VSWDHFQVFLAVHRGGSHARAARDLGVDATTIGRRLAALEASLGARLFDRTPAGLSLTSAGEAILVHAERAEMEIVAAEREVAGGDTRAAGHVRLTSGDGIAAYVLVPALVELRRRHAGLLVELRSDTRTLDLSRREADVAVRLARPSEPSVVARRVGTCRFSLYASRTYLERRGTPRSAKELAGHDFIGFQSELDDLPQLTWLRRLVPEPRWMLRANTTTAQVVACGEGLGIALLPTFIAPHEPRLTPILGRIEGPRRDIWTAAHADMRKNARVAVLLEWLAATFAGTRSAAIG
jgi:DNA-binding transcriptional LysR family regulator